LVSQVLGVIFGLGTLFLLLCLNKKLYPEENLFNYLAPLFLVSCGAFAAWCTGGLETSFYTFLTFLGAFFFLSGLKEPRYFAFSGISFALVCLTRLDGLIFAGVTFFFLCCLTLVGKRTGPRSLWAWSFAFGMPFLVYFVWRWHYYGAFLPNTFYVKAGGGGLMGQGLLYLLEFVRRFRIWLAVIPLAFLARRLTPGLKTIVIYFGFLILVFGLYVAYVGGDFMDMFRFLVPVLPPFCFLVQEGFRSMYRFLHSPTGKARRRSRVKSTLPAAEVLLIGMGIFFLVHPSRESTGVWNRAGMDSIGLLRVYANVWSKAGLMFKSTTGPGESLSTTAAGAIPYYSEMYTIDELGLTLRAHSHLKLRETVRAGHGKMVTVEYLLFRRPTYIIGHPLILQTRQLGGTLVVQDRDRALIRGGYHPLLVPVTVSDWDVKYLYCLSLEDSALEKLNILKMGSGEGENVK